MKIVVCFFIRQIGARRPHENGFIVAQIFVGHAVARARVELSEIGHGVSVGAGIPYVGEIKFQSFANRHSIHGQLDGLQTVVLKLVGRQLEVADVSFVRQ